MSTLFTYSPIKRLINLLKIEKKEVYAVYFYAALNGIIVLTLPLGIQAIINFILGGRISTSWIILVVIVMLALAFAGILQVISLYIVEKLQQRIFVKSSFEFAYRLPRVKLENLHGHFAPELVNRFFDTVTLQKGLAKLLTDISLSSFQLLFGLLLLCFYHPFFIAFGFIVILILVLIVRFTFPQGMNTSLNESAAKYEVAHWLEEIGRTLSTFKLAGISVLPFKKADKLLINYVDYRKKHFNVLVIQYFSMVFLKVLIVGALLIVGSLLLINDEISIGQFVAAEVIILLLLGSVEKLILSLDTIYDTLTSLEKLGTVTDLPLEEEKDGVIIRNHDLHGLKIEVDDLRFKFPDMDDDLLKGINLSIPPGQKVIITGGSGCGKSSLLHLLAGLYTGYKGQIRYDDHPLKSLNLQKLRHSIGDSISTESIFKGTLKDNLTLGREEISEDRVWEVIEQAGLRKFVNSMEEGLFTVLTPEGSRLSKANIRKILFARSIIHNPRLLILEELMVHESDKEELPFMDYLFASKFTMVGISKDWNILSMADRIIELQAGTIAFDGAYDEYEKFKKN